MRIGRLFAAALLACALAAPCRASAQVFTRPELSWETIRTAHFDVHYPTSMRAWAVDAAGRLESIRTAVVRLVGNAPGHRVTIVIDDPYNLPNGAALPVLTDPTIIFWPTPPMPDEDLGHTMDWAALLAVHEFTHIAHLTRPSRNPIDRALWRLLPVDLSPLPRRAPRWVMEGYATYAEGALTGSGRPNSALRAAVLRQWALEGRLPTYAELDGSAHYLGDDMAYLMGSAFLEWLVERGGPESLPHLWRRMTALQDRDFRAAFVGVFGDSPATLYGQFTSELTGKALHAATYIIATHLDSGSTFQHLTWETGDPAVSATGALIAVPVRTPGRPSQIVVWSTAPQPTLDSAIAAADAQLLARDPHDVPPVRVHPPPRRPIATLEAVHGVGYDHPRFFADGVRLLVAHVEPLADGALRPDLFIWNARTGDVRRVTHGAAIRVADPAADGRTAVGVRCLDGACDLVDIDLASGRISVLLRGSPSRQYAGPRFAPDGRSVIVAVNAGDRWHLERIPVDGTHVGTPQSFEFPDSASRYSPAFTGADTVVAVSEAGGVPHLEIIDLASGRATPLALATGALRAPDAAPGDSAVYFLSLSARGLDLHWISKYRATAERIIALPSEFAPATIPAPPPHPDSFPPGPVNRPTPYDLGPRGYRYFPGGAVGPSGRYLTLLVGSSDPVGRLNWTLQGALGDPGTWRGAPLAAIWRGLPVHIGGSAFYVSNFPSRASAGTFAPDSIDANYGGGVVSASLRHVGSQWSSAGRLGTSVGPIDLDGRSGMRNLAFAGYAGGGDFSRGSLTLQTVVGALGTIGSTDGSGWRRLLVRGTVALGYSGYILHYTATYTQVNHDAPAFERPTVGGEQPPLTDTALLAQRLPMPALPVGVVAGRQILAQRLEDDVGLFALYYDRFTTPTDRSAPHDVYGLEIRAGVPQVPFLSVPAISGLAGVGYSISDPFKYKLRGYFAIRFSP